MLKEVKNDYNEYLKKYTSLNPWTNIYGLSRSILAFGLILTISFSKIETLIMPININMDSIFIRYNFFFIFNNVYFSKIISILILSFIISGYFPQITCFFHWWINLSFLFASPIIEGGDQISTIITFLLIPVAITDKRINHWYKPKSINLPYTKLFVWSIFFLISIQVSFVYFHAGIAKLNVEEWLNGTAVYYWATHNVFGVNQSIYPFISYLLSHKIFVVSLTWGTIFLEILFFGFIFIKRNNWNWKLYFILGFLFHFLIIIFFGLFSFFFSMLGAIILYFVPKNIHISKNDYYVNI